MIIGTIVNGLVIDHIPAGRAMELYHYLELGKLEGEVAIIKNAPSTKSANGKKDIIKINEKIDVDLDILGYIDPQITVNVIQNGERVKKLHPELPEKITNVIQCKNPRCITSIEQELPHVFRLTDKASATYRCIYCDTKAKKVKID
ncbi:MAG: aspartate carbamoyltransferase regulatory subunit [Clostridia bacterium]|nr:aspartate carbamoyltransferase regulatory subunit [Clostridia bacterium]